MTGIGFFTSLHKFYRAVGRRVPMPTFSPNRRLGRMGTAGPPRYLSLMQPPLILINAQWVYDRAPHVREHNRQPVNTRTHRTELRYTGRAPFKKVAHAVRLMELMELDKNISRAAFSHDENWSTKTAIQVTPRKEEKGGGVARRREGNG